MAATNFILDIYTALWALLEAHTPVSSVLKIGNEVREDQNKLYPRTRGAKLVADFPRIYGKVGTTDGALSDETFASEDDAAFGWLEQIVQTYEFKIVHEACDLAKNSILELDVLTALRKGGQDLGFSYVTGWKYNVTRLETNKAEAAGQLRQITTIIIPVEITFEQAETVI